MWKPRPPGRLLKAGKPVESLSVGSCCILDATGYSQVAVFAHACSTSKIRVCPLLRGILSVPRGGESETQTSEQTCPKHYNQSVERSQLVFGLCLHAPFSGQRSRNKCLGIFFLLFNQVQSLESNLSLDLSLSSLCPTLGIILVSAFLGKEYNLKVAGW